MSTDQLTDLQKQVLEVFRKHTAVIGSDQAIVVERYGSGLDELGAGSVLELELRPHTATACPFSAMVGDQIAYVTVGRAQLDYLSHVDNQTEFWPEQIEQDLLDAIDGRVKEIEWRLGLVQLQLDTLRQDDAGHWVHLHSWGLPPLAFIWRFLAKLRIVKESAVLYSAY